MRKKTKITSNMSGITLIALVITIIVMLILAGVSLNVLVGDNGVLTQAQEAKTAYEEAEEKEKVDMAITGSQMNADAEIDYETLRKNIREEFGEDADVSKMENESTGIIDYIITLPNGKTYSTSSDLKILDIFIEESNPIKDETGIGVVGYMLELNQKIGLRYYFTMPDERLNTGATIKLSKNGTTEDISVDNVYSAIINGNSYYYVTAYCVAREMSKDITFCMYDENGEKISNEYTYSIKAYGNAVIEESKTHAGVQGQITEKEKEKVEYIKALLYYGGMTQKYLAILKNDSTIADNLASDVIDDASYTAEVFKEKYNTAYINKLMEGHEPAKLGDNPISYFDALAIEMGSELILRVYLSLTDENIEKEEIVGVKINEEDTLYKIEKKYYNQYSFDIPIKITEFDKMYDMYIVDADNNNVGIGTRYGMYAFFRSVLKEELSPDDSNYVRNQLYKDLIRAMIHLSECGQKIF